MICTPKECTPKKCTPERWNGGGNVLEFWRRLEIVEICNWNYDGIDVIQNKKLTEIENYWNCYDNWGKFWLYFRVPINNECN